MINIAAPTMGNEEIDAVNKVLSSGMLAQGPKVAELEANWAKYCGTKFALAVNSGTAAIHCALFAAGVKEEDEVITTPFSFIATINPILMVGAKPVLADIEEGSFNIDPSKIEELITKKTKAIIVVHLYGQPANMDEISRIAENHNIKIIEDACQAIGAEYKGKKAGNLGDLGCFSLYATKNIMCGEGGIVTTNDEEYANAIKRFRQHGMDSQYQYKHTGFNYRMSDLHAAIAIEQLKKVDEITSRRQENARKLDKELEGTVDVKLPTITENTTHAFHQYTIRIQGKTPREEIVATLREADIIPGVYYPKPLHYFDHIAKYGYKEGDFPVAEKAAEEVISLPVHPKLSEGDLTYIADKVKDIFN